MRGAMATGIVEPHQRASSGTMLQRENSHLRNLKTSTFVALKWYTFRRQRATRRGFAAQWCVRATLLG
jgi:hypothetical protein